MTAPRRAAVVVSALALLMTTIATADADPQDVSPSAPADPPAASDVGGSGTTSAVTLITGDTVLFMDSADGRTPQVRVDSPGPGGYEVRTEGEDVYVIPAAAEQALEAGRVDRQLFNVTKLVEQGYDDASTDAIPLIITYDNRLRSTPAVPVGATRARQLPSINADAVVADKATTAELWNAVQPQASRHSQHIDKIWLDAKVETTLDESVPFVGAPQAWAAGLDGAGTTVAVLDTGIDAEHPDVAAIAAKKNFTDSPDVTDVDGHGTHVASTVLGSGAASGGALSGVAPGAELLVGKVLGDDGFGELSWIIAGMEWAVGQDADVVNLSIGTGEVTPCDDPMVQAVDELSASSDTLFVVAAGNLGGPAETVTSPGCAASALTVGAVDLDSATANFSGRGPVPFTHAVKPDISAPGVGITAARADGRGDAAYTDMNGTSMATPHVAGAAAIAAQLHPQWDGEQIKALLQSTVRPDAAVNIYEQGAGILDVAAAATAPVAGPGTVDLGTQSWPHEPGDAVTTDVVYTNTGATDRALTFEVDARGENGEPLPDAAFELGQAELTVPAGGTASLPVTLDPSAGWSYGHYGAASIRLLARTDDGGTVVTPIGAYVEPKHVDVTFRVVGRDGELAADTSSLDVLDMDSLAAQRISLDGAEVDLRLRAGTYSVAAMAVTSDPETFQVTSLAYLAEPEIEITDDRTITLDARDARKVRVRTDQPAELHSGSVSYARIVDGWILSSTKYFREDVEGVYLSPTDPIRRGQFEVVDSWRYTSPEDADRPYDYYLAYPHHGRISPRDTVHIANRTNLATVTSSYNTPGDPDTYAEFFDAYSPVRYGYVPMGDVAEFDAPGTRTSYVTADPDIPVRQSVVHPDGSRWFWGTPMTSDTRPLEPGSEVGETWFGAGLRPAIPADADGPWDPVGRTGNVIWSNLPAWADSEPGHTSWQGLNDLGSTELFADGESLGRHGYYGQGNWDVPSDAHRYELVYDLTRYDRSHSTWTMPLSVHSRWGFDSAAADEPQALALLFPTYDVDVDERNRAAAVETYPVRVGVEATPAYEAGDIAAAGARVSYDDGETWSDAPVTTGDDGLTITVDNTPASGGYVSIEVTITDTNGVAVTQQVERLYGVL